MMIDKNIDADIFFLRNEELEAEQEKVGKRQLDMITDEFSMEVGSPELGCGIREVGSPELGFGLEIVKGWFVIKVVFFSQFCQTRMRTTSLSGIGRQKLKRQIGDYRRSEMRCGRCNLFSPMIYPFTLLQSLSLQY